MECYLYVLDYNYNYPNYTVPKNNLATQSYWKIEFDKNVITIEKNFSAFKSLKVYNLSSEDSLHLSNLKSLQFIKIFPLGKMYLEILRKIDNRNWSLVLENSEKEIINCLSENQATEILNFIKRK